MVNDSGHVVPQVVFVETHMGCSRNCRHCYQVREGFERNRCLLLDDVISRINQLKSLGIGKIVPVTGEVLEHPEYLEAYREASWTEYLVTNGLTVVRDAGLGALVASYGFRRLRISAHYGVPKFLSPCGDVTVPDIVRATAAHGMEVEAFNLIGSFNYERIGELLDRAQRDGLVRLWLINLIPTIEELRPFCLTPNQIQEVFRQVNDIREHDEGDFVRLRMLGNFGSRPGSWLGPKLAAEGHYCPAGREKAYIAVDGTVYGCHFMLESQSRFGRFVDGHFEMDQNRLNFDRSTCPLLTR